MSREVLLIRIVGILFFALIATSHAQERWPSRAITIVVPYAAGTAPDVIARQFGEALAGRAGQPVVIENKLGAGGLLGTEYAAAAKPDGYTLFLGTKDTQAIIGHLYPNRKVDPARDLTPVSLLGRIVNVIVAGSELNVGSMKELVAASRQGRTFTFASPGVGTNLHLLGELVKMEEKLNLTHVPYRHFGTAFQDAIAGRVDLVVAGLPPVASLVAAKKLKVLVTTARERVAAIPDTPTMAELGYKDLTFIGWFGLLAPSGTPEDILDRLNAIASQVTRDAAYRDRMLKIHVEAVGTTRAEFKALIEAESERLGALIRKIELKPEQ
jgi:tripartite-type tricarboxylate transporter receptor subunit TctC